MYGHSNGNHELLQEQFKLGYQNYILPETLDQSSFNAHGLKAVFLPAERCQLQTFGSFKIDATLHAFTRDQYLKNVRNRILEKIIIHFLYEFFVKKKFFLKKLNKISHK